VNAFAAVTLYPLWAVATAVGLTALRLGRSTGRGLVALCFGLAFWVTGLILLNNPATTALGERVVPAGVVLSGAFLHAGADVAGLARRRVVRVGYALGAAVAALGLAAPHLLYAPGARAPGPLFFPIAAASAVATVLEIGWLARLARDGDGRDRRRRGAIALGCFVASLGSGLAIGVRVLGFGEVELAAPTLLVSVLLVAYAVLSGEHGRARGLVTQGLAYAAVTASLSSVGLVAFYLALPGLSPGGGGAGALPWLVFVTFFVALPLDPLRLLAVEKVGRALFRDPIGVRDLADQIERSETRADHAERLAEIGRLASAVAHEIRNPLGVIAAQAKLLERAGASPASVAAVRAQVDRAKRFLDDLLRYSRPRPLDVTEIDALPALQLAAANVRQALGEGARTIDVRLVGPDVTGGLPLEVDRGAFNDVTTVLAHNAAIAVSEREDGRVSIEARREGGWVVVAVEDNGPGVPPELEATLFQPFVTGRGRDAKHPGTGLGLAIAVRWVERHGGSLRHERPAGGGARFVARWPGRAGAAPPQQGAPA
jgi:signal transduction histidine kinase